jgi:hypothetical protein
LRINLFVAAAVVAFAGATFAKPLDANLDALRAAIDPAKGPPIAQAIYPKHHPFPNLGGPGGYTPDRAARSNLAGMAVIQCALAASGKLSKCALLADGPLDQAYGLAAMKMARDGYLTAQPPPTAKDGDEVRVVVSFPRPSGR